MEIDPIIVVSDVHLGSGESNASAFYHFCGWLKELSGIPEGAQIINGPPNSPERRIKAPKTLILLGDILELWAPKAQAAPLEDGFTVLDTLLNLPCDKVYVLGNHDESLGDHCFFGKPRSESGSPACVQHAYECANGSRFLVVNGHYPNRRQRDRYDKDYAKERDDVADKEVVSVSRRQGSAKPPRQYVFLHGYQFDKIFRFAGPLRRFPGYVKAAADLVAAIHPKAGPTGLGFFIVFAVLGWMLGLDTAIGPISFFWWALLLICFGTGVVWAWTKLQKPAWTYVFQHFADRPHYSTIQQIIDEQYYDYRLDKTNPFSIIVFGHTHVPGSKVVEKEQMPTFSGNKCDTTSTPTKTKTFINCGAWVTPTTPTKSTLHKSLTTPRQREQNGPVPSNTFVYIDSEGPPLLLQWNDDTDKRYVQGCAPPGESPAR